MASGETRGAGFEGLTGTGERGGVPGGADPVGGGTESQLAPSEVDAAACTLTPVRELVEVVTVCAGGVEVA